MNTKIYIHVTGTFKQRRVFVYLSPDNRYLHYRSADKPEDTADVKRINLASVRHVHATSAKSFKLTNGKVYAFETDTREYCKQWLNALSAVVKVLKIPEPWLQTTNRRRDSASTTSTNSSSNELCFDEQKEKEKMDFLDTLNKSTRKTTRVTYTNERSRERQERRERLKQKYFSNASRNDTSVAIS